MAMTFEPIAGFVLGDGDVPPSLSEIHADLNMRTPLNTFPIVVSLNADRTISRVVKANLDREALVKSFLGQ
jgi:hypothetical protein